MTNYTFTDVITQETFEIQCEPHEIHNIELKNVELGKWCEGRILIRVNH